MCSGVVPQQPPYEAYPDIDKLARIARHVLGRAQIDVSSLHGARNAGVRLCGKRFRGDCAQTLQCVQHRDRTDAAIATDYVRAPFCQASPIMFGTRAVEAVAVFVNRHLRDDRDLRVNFARRENRLVQLAEVAKSFQDQQVNPRVHQDTDLFREGCPRLFTAGLAQRLDPYTQRSNRPGEIYIAASDRLPRQLHARAVDLCQPLMATMPRQSNRVGPEGIGLQDLRAVRHVVRMNGRDQFRLRHVELVVAAIDENAFGIEQRSHGPVAQDGTLRQPLQKRFLHLCSIANGTVVAKTPLPGTQAKPSALL